MRSDAPQWWVSNCIITYAMKGVPLCIVVNEAAIITRKSQRSAERLMNDIRFFYSKKKHQMITIKEFCEYTGLDYPEVVQHYYTPEFNYNLWPLTG